jgi:uncharacterized protein YbjT (DUF2867 family)
VKRYAARRDKNEPQIIRALEAAGAAVQQLEPPLPDLLVSFADQLSLLEVKDLDGGLATRSPHRGKGNRLEGPMAALTADQVRWWAYWRGKPAVIVHTPEEALAAIGAQT